MTKKIAVIILNWNRYQDTIDCIKSLKEVEDSNFEIIIVDNASTDGSVEQLSKRFPECKILQNKSNLGFAGGHNVGIKYALSHNYNFILLLNNDTVVEKSFLLPLIKKLEDDVDAAVVQAKLINYYDPAKIDSLGQKIISTGGMRDITDAKLCKNLIEPIEIFGACAAAALFRANIFSEVGLLDEAFFVLFEDADLSWRIRLKGYKIFLVPDSIVYHKRGISIGNRWNKIRSYYLPRNNLFLIIKYWPNIYFIKFLHFILYSLIKTTINASLRGEFHVFKDFLKQKVKERLSIQKELEIRKLYNQWFK